jgi:hypothetical protein
MPLLNAWCGIARGCTSVRPYLPGGLCIEASPDRARERAGAETSTQREVVMTDISKIKGLLEWKLLSGSHDWPGPDGGTCINEAAVVVAGFDYTPVGGADDFPPCFSRELGAMLLHLNDELSDERRQRLMRFVLQLPGSRDAAKVERARCRLIGDGVRRLLKEAGLSHRLLATGKIRSYEDRLAYAEEVGGVIAMTAEVSPLANEARDAFFDRTLDVIEQAFALGRRAPAADAALIEKRIAAARRSRETASA